MNIEKMASKLRMLRAEKNLTLEEMSKHIGISPNAISRYENGKSIPSDENKKRLGAFFAKTVQEIFYDD